MKVLLFTLTLVNLIAIAQEDFFPMKGNYIYYEFEEETNNTKHCIKHYLSSVDSTGKPNASAQEFLTNVYRKCQNLDEVKFTLTGFKITTVMMMMKPATNYSCIGQLKSPQRFNLTLPTGQQLLESKLLNSLLPVGKFKVLKRTITADVILDFKGYNKYSLIFTNFKIRYLVKRNGQVLGEDLDLEEVYNELQENGKQTGKMYDKSMLAWREIDKIIKHCAQIYSKELNRTYEIDQL